MKIRFLQDTKLKFINGWCHDLGQLKINSKDFAAGQELETFIEQDGKKVNLICSHGMADDVPAESFQILSLANN